MEEQLAEITIRLNEMKFWAPFIFIVLHIIRQIFFIPVHLIILLGGLLFGSIFGSVYSLIGLTLNCVIFYGCYRLFPISFKKVITLKTKWFGYDRNFTTSQIAILRLLPFVHYHIFNIFLVEKNPQFIPFFKKAFITNIPLVICYTIFGELIHDLAWIYIVLLVVIILVASFLLREKKVIIPWKEFFNSE